MTYTKLVDGVSVELDENEVAALLAQQEADNTPQELRARMPNISGRQLWLAAKSINITKADVLALVDAMEDRELADTLRIEITEAPLMGFVRTSAAVISLASLMGISEEQFDSIWLWAGTIE